VTLILTKTKYCISVYDKHALNAIDFFPNNKDGIKDLLAYLQSALKPKQKRKK